MQQIVIDESDESESYQRFRYFIRLTSDFGGLLVVLYLILLGLTNLVTRHSLQDYLVRELLNTASADDDDFAKS